MGEGHMPAPLISIRSPDLDRMAQQTGKAIAMRDEFVTRNLRALGHRVEYIMRRVLEPHRYSGSLADSVRSEVTGTSVAIGPTAKSGSWDRGLMLQMGTGPHAPPFEVIRRWAEFRGLPAGPVWATIVKRGTKAHPFLDDVVSQGDFQTALDATATRIGLDLVGYALSKMPGGDVSGVQAVSGGPT